ncbi:MAG: hypothetical protein QW350_04100 [Candidatus Aenigmatarchaeota archaeon]
MIYIKQSNNSIIWNPTVPGFSAINNFRDGDEVGFNYSLSTSDPRILIEFILKTTRPIKSDLFRQYLLSSKNLSLLIKPHEENKKSFYSTFKFLVDTPYGYVYEQSFSKGIYGSPSYVKFKGFSLMKNPNYRKLIFKKNYKDKEWKIKFTALHDSVLNELRIELTFKKFMEAKISIIYLRDFLKDMNAILFVKRSIEIFEHLVIYKK